MKWQFKDPLVRELAWCIGSSPLMARHPAKRPFDILGADWYSKQFEQHKGWLVDLDEKPASLHAAIPKGKLLLGKRFEALIGFWLENSPNFSIMDQNVVLQDKGRTVGELDFLIQDLPSGEHWHLEVACKFYLSSVNSPQWSSWIGPGAKDTLGLKMDKLDEQLHKLHTTAGQAYLKERKKNAFKSVLLMKGYFFHHFAHMSQAKAPKGAHPNYPSGWWLKENEMDAFFSAQRDTHWTVLPKKSWLSPFLANHTNDWARWNDYEAPLAIDALLTQYKRPLMVLKIAKRGEVWEELNRGFVVRKSWPNG